MMKIPDRWLDYKAIGAVIEGTRFISFKVPLREECVRNKLPSQDWFTIKSLIAELKDNGKYLGQVVDLTNTNKYYSKNDFEKESIQYKKIYTVGHVVPSIDVQNRFRKVVDDFLHVNSDNDLLIGVHCTHGLNRTGYLVCRYMIDHLNIEPETAIKAFNTARGHEMERENYLNDLRSDGTNGGCPKRSKIQEDDSYSELNGFHTDSPNNQRYGNFSNHSNQRIRYDMNSSDKSRQFENSGRSSRDTDWRKKSRDIECVSRSAQDAGSSSRGARNEGRSHRVPWDVESVSRGAQNAGWSTSTRGARNEGGYHKGSRDVSRGAQDAGWSTGGARNEGWSHRGPWDVESVSRGAQNAGWSRNEGGSHRGSRDVSRGAQDAGWTTVGARRKERSHRGSRNVESVSRGAQDAGWSTRTHRFGSSSQNNEIGLKKSSKKPYVRDSRKKHSDNNVKQPQHKRFCSDR